MTVIELINSRPDIVAIAAAIGTLCTTLVTLAARGYLHVIVVIRKPVQGHREGIVRVEIGQESSERIPTGEQRVITDDDLKERKP